MKNDRSPSGRKWLNARKAAEYAGIGHTTFYDWIREGKLPFRSYPIAPPVSGNLIRPTSMHGWNLVVRGQGQSLFFRGSANERRDVCKEKCANQTRGPCKPRNSAPASNPTNGRENRWKLSMSRAQSV
jgi:hypothetical protein